MKVYIVVDGTDFEGYNIKAVFNSLEAAQAFRESYLADCMAGDYVDILEWEVQ